MIEKTFTLEQKKQFIPEDGPILMVDDSEIDTMIVRRVYKSLDLPYPFEVISSGSGFLDYLKLVKAGQEPMPRAVLLDINMPGLDGFEVLEMMRRDEDFSDIPVVVMLTNSDRSEDARRAEELGADAFKTKPYRLNEYESFFRHYLL